MQKKQILINQNKTERLQKEEVNKFQDKNLLTKIKISKILNKKHQFHKSKNQNKILK